MLLGAAIIAALAALGWLDAWSEESLRPGPWEDGRFSGLLGPWARWVAPPGFWLLPALVAFTFFATDEILGLAEAAGVRPLRGPAFLANLLLWAGDIFLVFSPWLWTIDDAFLRLLPAGDMAGHRAWVLAVLALAASLILLGEMTRYERPGGALASAAATVFVFVYVGVMLDFAFQLRLGWGVGALASWIIAVKAGDIGAYTVGRLIGRHKLCPRVSPGKTVEGAVGALVFAVAGAWASLVWLVPTAGRHPLACLVYGLLMGITGMFGDLAESLLKRDAGVKDSSRWMPGFGGVLDILDSLLLSAPVAWLCWSLGLLG
jgi:phosphatidate cytidylyltransferase